MSEKSDLPVLTDVVKRGDEDVIKAARLEREIFDELNRMAPRDRTAADRKLEEPTQLSRSDEDSLEQAVESIIDFHSNAMRQELLNLLRERR